MVATPVYNAAAPVGSWLSSGRIAPNPSGAIALPSGTNDTETLALSTTSSGLSLGAIGSATYGGTLTTPAATVYLGGGGGTLYFSSNITGTQSLAVGSQCLAGGGVILTSSNTYSGSTSVTSGTLGIGASGSIAAASAISVSNSSTLAVSAAANLPGNAITVNPGSLFDTTAAGGSFSLGPGNLLTIGRPSGAGTDINGNFTLGGGTINIGGSGIAATLTEAGGLTLGGGALMFDVSSTGASDLANVTNLNLSSATGININMLGGSLSNGNYSLINYSGSLSGGASVLTLNGVAGNRQAFSLATTAPSAGTLILQVSAAPASLIWTGQQNGQWDLSTLNWNNSGAADKFYQGDSVTFDDTAGTAAVTLNTNVQPGSVLVNNNLLTYTFSGSGSIGGSGSLTKDGSGALVLSLSNAYTGGTIINAGFVQAGNNSALGASTAALAVNGGTLDVHGYNLNVGPLSGAGTIDNLSGSGALTVGNGNTSGTFSGTVQNSSGQLSLIKAGSGSFGLTGNVILAGTTTVSGGSVNQSGGYLQSAAILVDGGAYSLSGTGQISAANQYVGYSSLGTFTQTGGSNAIAGALYLGTNVGANGTYNLVGGTLNVSSILQGSGSSSLTITGGVLTGLASGGTLSLPIVLTSSATSSGTFDTSSSSLTVASQISGSGSLTKTGSATLAMAGNNTYSGGTTVSRAQLLLANSKAAQNTTVAVSVDNGLLFSSGIGAFNVGSLGGSGNLALADTGGNPVTVVTGGNNASTTYSGVISGSGVLVHIGSGTLVLSGTNTYSGGTILGPDAPGGTLIVTNSAALGTGPVTYTGYNTLQFAAGMTLSNTFSLNSNITGTIDTASYTVTLAGPITGPGNLSKVDSGTLILSNSNSDSGVTSISQGELQLANSAALQNSTVSINTDNGLQFSPGIGTLSVGGLSGSSALTLNDTAGDPVTLEVGSNNANTTFGGSISGSGGLVKNGYGSLTLTGTNSFDGGMRLDPGIVSITSDAALGAVPSSPSTNIIFEANSTLQAGGSFALATNRNILLSPATTATFDTNRNTLTIGGIITGSGALAVVGSGTLVLTNAETFTGGTTIGAATLQLGNGGSTGWVNGNIVDNGLLVFDRSDSPSFSAAISGSGGIRQAGSGTLFFGGTNTFTGNAILSGGTLELGNATALQSSTVVLSGGTLNLNGLSATLGGLAGTGNLALGSGSLTVGGDGNTTTYSGSLSGAGALIKAGSGALALTGSNSFLGGTTLDQGILSIGSDAALSAIPASPSTNITFAANSTLQVLGSFPLSVNRNISISASSTGTFDTHGGTLTIGSVISGSGALAVVGGGTLLLTNAETLSGGTTTINAATLQLGNGGSTGWVNGSFVDNGLLVFDRSDSPSFSAAISGSGSIQQEGTGTLLFGGTNTFTGNAILSGGVFKLGNAAALQSCTVVCSGGTLDFNTFNATLGGLAGSGSLSLTDGTLTIGGNGNSTTFAGTLLGLASFIKSGSGLLVLAGTNSYQGVTTINAGTLEASTPGSIPGLLNSNSNSVIVSPGGLLAVGVGGAQQWTTGNISLLLANTALFTSAGSLGIDTSGGNFSETNLADLSHSRGSLGLVKLGPNTLLLTGTNSYSGGTFVNGGVLEVTSTSALPAPLLKAW